MLYPENTRPFICELKGVELETLVRFVCVTGRAFSNSILRVRIITCLHCVPFCGVTLIERSL